jgi:starch synthase
MMLYPTRMNVLYLSAEAAPLIKVGGLGDVAGSLPQALLSVRDSSQPGMPGLDIRLVIPFHPSINLEGRTPSLEAVYPVKASSGEIEARAYRIDINNLPVYLIGGPPIDSESGVYSLDLEADGFKYIFFSMAALELPQRIGWAPDIYHANDWHTAAAIYSLNLRRPVEQFYHLAASLLTIHNLPYLGSMTSAALVDFGLPTASDSDLPPWAQDMALPLGLLAADEIVPVSPGYAREILTEEFGSGLSEFLQARQQKIHGILNGLDTLRWDPRHDSAIHTTYSIDRIADRVANKTALRELLGFMDEQSVPLLAMITRMDPQKGVDIAVAALRLLLESSSDPAFQVVFLGKGDSNLEETVCQLEQDYPSQVHTCILYDEHLSRKIYAGADALLMPSRYEPCGLSQMIAMRYGCIPIARATGGLIDTIYDPKDTGEPTGFLFDKSKPEDLAKAIQRALQIYTDDPQLWQRMRMNGMQQDFSWNRSASEYLDRYRSLIHR